MKKASALIIALLILSTILLIGLSVSVTTVKEQKSAMESEKSSIAYQIAETGIEDAIRRLLANPTLSISSNFPNPPFSSCSSGKVNQSTGGGIYTVSFMKDSVMGGETAAACGDLASVVRSISSSATFRNVSRSVRAPVVFP